MSPFAGHGGRRVTPSAGHGGGNGVTAWAARSTAAPVVVLVILVTADVVVAGTVSAAGLGHGWCWPPTSHLVATVVGVVGHPGQPARGWPSELSARMPGPLGYWSVFGMLLAVGAAAAAAVSHRAAARGSGGGPLPHRGRGGRGSRRPNGVTPRQGRRRTTCPGLLCRPPLQDARDRYGFASPRQLRQEASTAAARRRAPADVPILGCRRSLLASPPGTRGRLPAWAHPRPGHAAVAQLEASLRLVAPPGEGKTFRVLAPILRQHPGPVLATSTKADIYELTALARQRRGPVFSVDPDCLVPAAAPARWSPVAGCERSEVAERRAAALVAATGDDGDVQNGAFFKDSARDLLKAYLHAAALEGLDIRAVLEWSRRPEDPTPAEILACAPFASPGWGDLVGLHTTGAAETTSGVLRYVARALSCFSHESVVGMCCPSPGEELDIERLLMGNGTVYLLGKGSRLGAVAPLVTAFADEVFDCAERLAARMPGRRLDPPLLGLLDEAPGIAPLPTLPELLADGRGRGIVLVYAMQSFSQAVTRWGAQKAETMGNATTVTAVLGGLTSPADLSDLERLCGQRRARRESTHQGTGPGRERSRTVSWENEAVLRADRDPHPPLGDRPRPLGPPAPCPGPPTAAFGTPGLASSAAGGGNGSGGERPGPPGGPSGLWRCPRRRAGRPGRPVPGSPVPPRTHPQ